MICGNADSQWVTASDFAEGTPKEVLDTVMSAYENEDEEESRFW
jgi:hypothetical protein